RGRAHMKLSQESYQRMFKLDPKSARVHQVLAQSYEEAGREADAIAEYELTVQLAPNMPGIHESLGSLYWKTAEMDKAEAAFQKELGNDPNNFLALYKLGSIRVERGKPEQGLPLLEQAIRQNPGEVDAYYYLGKGQGILGRHEAAVANLQKVVVGDTSAQLIESAYYQLSQNYRKLGRVAEARTAIEKFQKLKGERERQQAEKVEQIKKQTTSQ
ncbi:MAG: tetratricopeptide repeat protein, partial [Acidobacteriota bacterium]|nr:tetratricopeptide repeat protein [Acidobacteriota bacterium]